MMEAETKNTTNPNKHTHAIPVDMTSLPRPQQKRRRYLLWSFMLFFGCPLLLVTLYYGWIATDRLN